MHSAGLACIASALLALSAAGCATFAPPPRVAFEPKALAPMPFNGKRAPIALVLSGGSARGFAHVGVLKVLEENGMRPDIIVGTSAGSVVGALYASGQSAAQVDRELTGMTASVFRDFVFPGLGVLPGAPGLVRGERLQNFMRDRLRHERIEDFPIRFAAIATDMKTGLPAALNAGDAALAVRASAAVPGLITPAEIGGRYYGDGQISSPLPIAEARKLGAKIVVAVDVLYPPEDALLSSVFAVVFQAFTISVNRLRDYEARDADVLIAPTFPSTDSQFGLSEREMLIRIGESAARAALPRLRQAFGH